jgi:pimeloyl-ACP methyl ester carboxylesterase
MNSNKLEAAIAGKTQYLETGTGKIAYDEAGEGPLLLLGHGLADNRTAFRFLAPTLVEAGYRVATFDMRGHGESSVGWASYSRTDVAADMAALIRHLGGSAVVIGHSFAGGSAAIVAADHPDLVPAIVQIDPGTRTPKIGRVTGRWLKAVSLILGAGVFQSRRIWARYLRLAYPGRRPADFEGALAALLANLREPGRMAAGAKMMFSSPADAEAKLADVAVPALVVMGMLDPDFPDPRAEAEAIVAGLADGAYAMIDGSGHYPHAQHADEVAAAILPFLDKHARA